MTNQRPSFAKVPPPRKSTGEEFDVGNELVGYGLQGVKVTHDDLAQLVAELGLDGDDAGDLVKSLGGSNPEPPPSKAASKPKEDDPPPPPPPEKEKVKDASAEETAKDATTTTEEAPKVEGVKS